MAVDSRHDCPAQSWEHTHTFHKPRQKEQTGISKPTSRDIVPLARLCLPMPPAKQHPQLGTKPSNSWAYGDMSPDTNYHSGHVQVAGLFSVCPHAQLDTWNLCHGAKQGESAEFHFPSCCKRPKMELKSDTNVSREKWAQTDNSIKPTKQQIFKP